MNHVAVSVMVLLILVAGLWLVGVFDGTSPSPSELLERDSLASDYETPNTRSEQIYLTGFTKPEDATQDVWDVLSLSTRKAIYMRDWRARERINEYVEARYPVDSDAAIRGDFSSLEANDAAWERLYVEHELEVCMEYQIPEWMLFQILDEGVRNRWHMDV